MPACGCRKGVDTVTVRQWFLVLLTAALFGSSFFFIKLATPAVPPLTIAAARAGIAALIVAIAAMATGMRLPRFGRDWLILMTVGLLTAIIPYAAIAAGQRYIDSALGGILFATIPLFTVLLAPLFLPGERLTARRMAGALIGLAGVSAVIGPQVLADMQAQLLGTLMTVAAAASYALGAIVSRRSGHMAPMVLAAGQLVTATPVLVLLSLYFDAPWRLQPSLSALAALGAAGLIATALPVLLFFVLIRDIGATRASLLTFFMPVFAVLLGAVFLGERPGLFALVGLGLIFAGAFLVSGPVAAPTAADARS